MEPEVGQSQIGKDGTVSTPSRVSVSRTPSKSRVRAAIPQWGQSISAELASLKLQLAKPAADSATTPGAPAAAIEGAGAPDSSSSSSTDSEASEEEREDDLPTRARGLTTSEPTEEEEELWVAELTPLLQPTSRINERDRQEVRAILLLHRVAHLFGTADRTFIKERLRTLLIANQYGWPSALKVARKTHARNLGLDPDELLPVPTGRGRRIPTRQAPGPITPLLSHTGPGLVKKPRCRGKRGSGKGRGTTTFAPGVDPQGRSLR